MNFLLFFYHAHKKAPVNRGFSSILIMRPLHDRGAKEKYAKIFLIEAGNAVNI